MAQAIRLRVRRHDVYQLEFKIDYRLASNKQTRYRIDIYFFIPHSLDINARSFSADEFYRDAKNHVRLRTPRLSLETLATAAASPLVHCEGIANIPGWAEDESLRSEMITSLKLMRPVLNASLRRQIRRIAPGRSKSSDQNAELHELESSFDRLMERTEEIVRRFRALGQLICEADPHGSVESVYRLADEAVSLVLENVALTAYQALDSYPKNDQTDRLREQIYDLSQQEIVYRQRCGYVRLRCQPEENEDYLLRASLLKKLTIAPLFLNTSVRREGTATEQMFYALAAGLSMIFATVIAFYAQARYGMFTFPLFVALVVGYMFKDRIKEAGRVLFSRYIRRHFYDQRTSLRAASGEKDLGYMREKVDFISHDEVNDEVMQERNSHLPYGVCSRELDEEILHYAKEVVIDRRALQHLDQYWLEFRGVRDITRYDVRPFLNKMAAPLQEQPLLKDGALHTVQCHKSYQLHVVIQHRSSEDGEQVHLQHSIVQLDRDGILSIKSG